MAVQEALDCFGQEPTTDEDEIGAEQKKNTTDNTEENTTCDKNDMSDGVEGTIDPVRTEVCQDSLVHEQRQNSMSRELETAIPEESDRKVVGWLHDETGSVLKNGVLWWMCPDCMAWTTIRRMELLDHEDATQSLTVSRQVCDVELFPMRKGRNLTEPEMCMTKICQIGTKDFHSFDPESRHRPGTEGTHRPKQSKQGQLWVRHEGKHEWWTYRVFFLISLESKPNLTRNGHF